METFFRTTWGKILQCCPNLLSHVISVHSLCDGVLSCSATQLAEARRKFPHSATVAYPVTKSGFRAGQPQRTPTVRSSHPGVEVDRTSGARRCPGDQSE
ncbi:hypothetical protein PHYPO_G00025270 [Pangasianodon hypophthalmus]|uniref:Uncharacterized protein n=1 Tax=Pangasianodon hypophthalmus TaxID=310915 RepID=A0A5N5MVK7_PANHP|nr:hypothetical protein PHYPO_G00025270 [Pangasianodon hypophthalmus]